MPPMSAGIGRGMTNNPQTSEKPLTVLAKPESTAKPELKPATTAPATSNVIEQPKKL